MESTLHDTFGSIPNRGFLIYARRMLSTQVRSEGAEIEESEVLET